MPNLMGIKVSHKPEFLYLWGYIVIINDNQSITKDRIHVITPIERFEKPCFRCLGKLQSHVFKPLKPGFDELIKPLNYNEKNRLDRKTKKISCI